jgi:hypothetical protein
MYGEDSNLINWRMGEAADSLNDTLAHAVMGKDAADAAALAEELEQRSRPDSLFDGVIFPTANGKNNGEWGPHYINVRDTERIVTARAAPQPEVDFRAGDVLVQVIPTGVKLYNKDEFTAWDAEEAWDVLGDFIDAARDYWIELRREQDYNAGRYGRGASDRAAVLRRAGL